MAGRRWTEEEKLFRSQLMKSKVNDEYRKNCAKANKGKKFSKERIANMHSHRSSDSYSHLHTEESKNIIGIKSSEKFTKEFKERRRKVMEDRGHWIKLSDKSDYQIYFVLSDWQERMWDKIENEDQLKLLKEIGVFNNKTNFNGVVRDHIFSRREGLELGVFPEILRHPSNCQILTAKDNIKKKIRKYIDRSDISLEDLFRNIEKYDKNWFEQNEVLVQIQKYKSGLRWQRERR